MKTVSSGLDLLIPVATAFLSYQWISLTQFVLGDHVWKLLGLAVVLLAGAYWHGRLVERYKDER